MTALRPEGGAQGGTGDHDGWGVYEPAEPEQDDRTMRLRLPAPATAQEPPDSRSERRRAEKARALGPGPGRRRAAGRGGAARVRPKERARVVAARLVGELFITLGVVMLLFVSYQLWWTNVQADQQADAAGQQLEQQWNGQQQPTAAPGAPGAKPAGTFEPGQGFAIIHIPKLGLKYPVAEGTQKQQVLDKGLVGHYTGTAMPADAAGNFAVAAHRTTHGQPFRKIGQLAPGDLIVVETATAYYTYKVAGGIPETPPTNVGVIQPVPKGSPFTRPGRYITLTTCTPEFSARGRLIVFGSMTEERPRSQGQPDALTGRQ
ncbi:class E sortase [Kitasatospora terrestris]|uniref:Class E sortase n=1 Tax=Kitasatospora terrestris TaxID=258051 RepID=A0ABP9DZ04_9ACTN